MAFNVLKHNSGLTIISVIFLLTLVSFFIAILNEQTIYKANLSNPANYDNKLATQIATLGINMGMNEWKKNPTAHIDYTPNVNVLTGFSISGGTLDLSFHATPDFSSNPITINSIAKVNNTTVTIAVTIKRTLNKLMALIKPSTPDLQYNIRKPALEALGWNITEIDDNSASIVFELNQKRFNVAYIPHNSIALSSILTNATQTIVAETITDTNHFGLLAIPTPPILVSTDNHISSASSQILAPPNTTINFSSPAMSVYTFPLANIISAANGGKIEASPPSSDPSVFWQEPISKDKIRATLNLPISTANPWSAISNDGLIMISDILNYLGCNYISCYDIEIINWEYL